MSWDDGEVRAATADDYALLGDVFDQVERLHRVALPEVFHEPPSRFPSRSLFASMVEALDAGVFVAISDEGDAVGFVTVRVSEVAASDIERPQRNAHVDMLAVREDRRSRGAGTALMAACESWARDRGLERITLNVWEFNDGARSFYEHLGYRTLSRVMAHDLRQG